MPVALQAAVIVKKDERRISCNQKCEKRVGGRSSKTTMTASSSSNSNS